MNRIGRHSDRTALGIALALFLAALVFPLTGSAADRFYRLDTGSSPAKGMRIDKITAPPWQDRFTPLESDGINITRQQPEAWIKILLPASSCREQKAPRILNISPSFPLILDHADLYLPDSAHGEGDSGFIPLYRGARIPGMQNPFPARGIIFELPETNGGAAYLRLASGMDVHVSLSVVEHDAFHKQNTIYFTVFGLVYGILAAMLLYNLFIFFSLKDRANLYYSLYILSGTAWQIWVQGHVTAFFGAFPGLDLPLLWILVGLTILFGGLFTYVFLEVRHSLPKIKPLFFIIMGIGGSSALSGVTGPPALGFALSHLGGLLLPLLCAAASILRIRQGFIPARYYLAAWISILFSGLVFALMGLHLLPVNFFTVNSIILGMVVEAMLMSLALASKIRALRKEKEYYKERRRQYRKLSITDSLTGLFNRGYLIQTLDLEAARAVQLNQPLALVMIDLDNFKTLNDTHGHPAGDEVLVFLGKTIQTHIRREDTACRFGGEEFMIIMPGTHAKDALKVAERIREQFYAGEFTFAGINGIRVSASMGLTQLMPGEKTAELIRRVDTALYQAKQKGKNRTITLLQDPPPKPSE